MTWQPPDDWHDRLRDELSAAAHDAGMTMGAVGRAMGNRNAPAQWLRSEGAVLPNVSTIVRFCAVVGVSPSELLAKAGL
jgi:hypothetical protein